MRLLDRDENAALNIVKKGLIGMPDGLASEAMVKESSKGVILLVDASQVQS
jgi:transposase